MGNAAWDAAAVLAEMDSLKNKSRRLAHGGAWLPALVLAVLPLLSTVLYLHPFSSTINFDGDRSGEATIQFPYWAGLPEHQRSGVGSYFYWLLMAPLAFVLVAQWYRNREHSLGVRVPWRVPVFAATTALLGLLALFAAPTGKLTTGFSGIGFSWWPGLLTPLLSVAIAAFALGLIERSIAITVSGAWMAIMAWQFCATGRIGGLLGWQAWILGGGSGPALGGQVTALGLDRPAFALMAMVLPLALTGLVKLGQSRGQVT